MIWSGLCWLSKQRRMRPHWNLRHLLACKNRNSYCENIPHLIRIPSEFHPPHNLNSIHSHFITVTFKWLKAIQLNLSVFNRSFFFHFSNLFEILISVFFLYLFFFEPVNCAGWCGWKALSWPVISLLSARYLLSIFRCRKEREKGGGGWVRGGEREGEREKKRDK